eukprot:8564724-Alexandrium_andersonii.AAC.1
MREDEASVALFDLYKAFDQANRAALYCLLLRGGFPRRLLVAYAGFMEVLVYRAALQTGVGAPRMRRCSFPQGCPWSMMHMAVLTAPWQRGIERCIGATGRVLADDLMLEVGLGQSMSEEQVFEAHCDG